MASSIQDHTMKAQPDKQQENLECGLCSTPSSQAKLVSPTIPGEPSVDRHIKHAMQKLAWALCEGLSDISELGGMHVSSKPVPGGSAATEVRHCAGYGASLTRCLVHTID